MSKHLPALFEANQEIKFYEVNGEFCLTAEDIGKGLGYSDPANSVNRLYRQYEDELKEYSVESTDLRSGGLPVRLFTEEGIYIISMLARTEKAKEFRKKVAVLLKDLRRQRMEAVRIDAAHAAIRLHERFERGGHDRLWLKRLIKYRSIGLSKLDTSKLLGCSKDTVRRYEAELKKSGLWEAL
jgi:prophage antirepressor-like protein